MSEDKKYTDEEILEGIKEKDGVILSEEDNIRLRKDLFAKQSLEIEKLLQEKKLLQDRVDELTAFVFIMAEGRENEAFNDSIEATDRQNASRLIKSRLRLSPRQMEIVNISKDRQIQEQSQQQQQQQQQQGTPQ